MHRGSERDFLSRYRDYFVQVLFMSRTTIYFISETKGPHHMHSLIKKLLDYVTSQRMQRSKVTGNLVIVMKFTFQSVFGNSRKNPWHASAQGREESLGLHSILWSDWRKWKQKVLLHGNRFVGDARRRYFSEEEKRLTVSLALTSVPRRLLGRLYAIINGGCWKMRAINLSFAIDWRKYQRLFALGEYDWSFPCPWRANSLPVWARELFAFVAASDDKIGIFHNPLFLYVVWWAYPPKS